jgi:prephenate dehydrogenase
MRIAELRAEIDEIDQRLIQLLNRRARTAIEIGRLKQTANLPLCDVAREREVVAKVCQANTGPLDDNSVSKLFRRIIRESRSIEGRVVEQSSREADVDHCCGEVNLRKVTVVGCGLMGASFALALRRSCPDVRIAGWDSSTIVLEKALERGIIDEIDDAFASDQTSTSDLIYLAIPVRNIKSFFRDHGHQIAPGTIVSDAGSTKAEVCEAARNYLTNGQVFIGGHPVAGSHLGGLEHARADMFENASYVLIKEDSSESAFATMTALVKGLGARVVITTAAEHDQAMAFVSHLPQLISSVLAATIEKQAQADTLKQMAGSGYRDMTRLAQSSWSMWGDIFATNTLPIANALNEMLDELDVLRDELSQDSDRSNPPLARTSALFNSRVFQNSTILV